jgi:hypothetical protein
MSGRDVFLVAITATISSFLTYSYCTRLTTLPAAASHEIAAGKAEPAPAPSVPRTVVQVETTRDWPQVRVATQQASSKQDAATPPGDGAPRDRALAYQKEREFGERVTAFINAGNPDPQAISARLENRFYLEEWNREWAGDRESSIRTLFEANEVLSGVVPLQVTCRSKNCQVVLSATSLEQVRQLSGQFLQATAKNDLGMNDKMVSFFPDTSSGRLVFYLSENANTDLFR